LPQAYDYYPLGRPQLGLDRYCVNKKSTSCFGKLSMTYFFINYFPTPLLCLRQAGVELAHVGVLVVNEDNRERMRLALPLFEAHGAGLA
jgi:hypothetical protein